LANLKLRITGGRNMIISLRKDELDAFRTRLAEASRHGKSFVLPVGVPPKGLADGSRCYLSVDKHIVGWVRFVGVVPHEEAVMTESGDRLATRFKWFIVLEGPMVEERTASPLKRPLPVGQYRYCDEV
jgi:hypothetical protein